jgi:hypothetical protein
MLLPLANRPAVGNEKSANLADLHDRGDGRTVFLVQFGLSMSALFVTVSIIQLTAIALLGKCSGPRRSYSLGQRSVESKHRAIPRYETSEYPGHLDTYWTSDR